MVYYIPSITVPRLGPLLNVQRGKQVTTIPLPIIWNIPIEIQGLANTLHRHATYSIIIPETDIQLTNKEPVYFPPTNRFKLDQQKSPSYKLRRVPGRKLRPPILAERRERYYEFAITITIPGRICVASTGSIVTLVLMAALSNAKGGRGETSSGSGGLI